ncbi:hypothetical protein BGZ60DRAFT_271709 [Tricladium varicosporioides]|nr:hypothetical protein BGZ60DRAFT_271709 [Hymenoscyphus varicosporioides]
MEDTEIKHDRKRRRQTPEDISQKRLCQTHVTPVGVIHLTDTCEQYAIRDSPSPEVRLLSGEDIKDPGSRDTPKSLPTTGGPFKNKQLTGHSVRNLKEEDAPRDALFTFTPPSGTPNIFFTIPGKGLKYDLDNPIPASHFHEFSFAEFFSLISKRTNISYSSITCLTFEVVFASKAVKNTKVVVSKEVEDKDWSSLKKLLKRMYRMTMVTRPWPTKFEVLVDIGNTQCVLD